MKKIITVLGARPQFIKAAMLSRELRKHDGIKEIIVHTGQHFDENMSKIFFDQMGIPQPDYFLDINSMTHGAMTGRMLEAIEKILVKEKPDCLIVYGDTNSTIAGALAAVKLQVPIAHVEAGIRSGYYLPEEVNRILTDNISNFLYCPSKRAVNCLKSSGISHEGVVNVGDIMYDSTLCFSQLFDDSFLVRYKLSKKNYTLVTLHREENTNNKEYLNNIVDQLVNLAKTDTIVFPMHPRTRKCLIAAGLYEKLSQCITVLDPQSYVDTLGLVKYSQHVITDSGGLQKEAFYLGVPALVIKHKTEWPELLQTGLVRLLSPSHIANLSENLNFSAGDDSKEKPYGSGNTAPLIVDHLLRMLCKKKRVN